MSHRDVCLVTTVEEATQWLEMYRHTLGFDAQALRVIEILESALDNDVPKLEGQVEELNDQITELNEQITELNERIETIKSAASDWTEYVIEDNAPHSLTKHLEDL